MNHPATMSSGVAALNELLAPHFAGLESKIGRLCDAIANGAKPLPNVTPTGAGGCGGGSCGGGSCGTGSCGGGSCGSKSLPLPFVLPAVPGGPAPPLPTAMTLCTPESVASSITANCLSGPPTETECTRRARQLAKNASVYTITSTEAAFGPAAGLGYSPYTPTSLATDDITFIVNVPNENLAALTCVCEFEVEVIDATPDAFNYAAGPAGMVSARSSWYAQQDDVAGAVSQGSGQVFGRKLLTMDGRCSCACVRGWTTHDNHVQIEFTVPGLNTGNILATTAITVRFEADRSYCVLPCAFPAKCSEPDFAEPSATILP